MDTPGLRGVAPHDSDDGLDQTFAGINELADGCRFSDCAHAGEPAPEGPGKTTVPDTSATSRSTPSPDASSADRRVETPRAWKFKPMRAAPHTHVTSGRVREKRGEFSCKRPEHSTADGPTGVSPP